MATTPKKTAAPARKAAVARKAPAAARKAAPAKPVVAKPAASLPAPQAAKPVATPAAAKPAKVDKTDKRKKPKMVRDSFTMPKDEYAVIEALKERALRVGAAAKKSELLRAGIKALAALSDAAFLAAVKAVPTLKTGRPAKD